jgi:glutaredoxin-like YruB-family protein
MRHSLFLITQSKKQMQTVNSLADFRQKTSGHERVVLLLHKAGNESSECAFRTLSEVSGEIQSIPFFTADVNLVRDIHPEYRITSVPSFLLFENGKLVSVIKGCQDTGFLKAVVNNNLAGSATAGDEKKAKQVTVYSTPTCSWCNTLKNWLRQNRISFTDIDISHDEKAAQNLVRRSGQQGVPQTEINGQIVVGFDQPKLKKLLEI